MALWLPRLPTDRLRRAGATPPDARPVATYEKVKNAFALTGLDRMASQSGLHAGMALADARAMRPDLYAVEANPQADAELLDEIAEWCGRYTPIVVVDPPHGLFLDITGCAHLFGGEDTMLRDVERRIAAEGFALKAAIAPTPGAAFALSRAGKRMPTTPSPRHLRGEGARRADEGQRQSLKQSSEKQPNDEALEESTICLPFQRCPSSDPSGHLLPVRTGRREGELAAALAPLPVYALRLIPESTALLRRLGLKTIGQIMHAPRQPFAARAGQHAMLRLDQALDRAPEALTPRRPAPQLFAQRLLVEPILTMEAVLIVTETLCGDLCAQLSEQGSGARLLHLSLFGVDNKVRMVELGLSRAESDPKIMLRLLRERLGASPEALDAEFGFDAMRLDAIEIAPVILRAIDLAPKAGRDMEAEARLIDRLTARLGPARIGRPQLNLVHGPERANQWAGPDSKAGKPPAPPQDGVMRRPIRLFKRAQPVEAMAALPDDPPMRFRWRRVLHEVVQAEGPERITPDWLRAPSARPRDYYRVEDREGRRFWLYREDHHDAGEAPRWYLHGLFA
jgi:protein ImuB